MLARSFFPLALTFLLPTLALADETNPAAEACKDKAEGAPCSADRIVQVDGKAEKRNEPGSCQPDQCCALDYSSGSPPKTTCGACLVCKPGAPTPSTTGDTANASGGEPPRAEGGEPPAVAPNEKRGCAIAATTKAEQPHQKWWLLGLVLIAKRRRSVSRRTSSPCPSSRR